MNFPYPHFAQMEIYIETTSTDEKGGSNSESHFIKNIYLKKYNCPYLVAHTSINISIEFWTSIFDTVLS